MVTEEIKLEKGQYLADVYPLIETNIILNKKLSGVGATQCEIIAHRNSIIVVPNIPIITCKVKKHAKSDNLFGVMQNVSTREIEEYLENSLSQNRHIKIMVTPESFYKVRQSFDDAGINMYETCFLLLDECHKFIKERNFRKDIVQPFRSFFKFKNKALVSATPIIPSDPRFNEQNFKLVNVAPQYYHLFEITIIETNDLRQAFYDDTDWERCGNIPSEPHCVFVNSATIIGDLIKQSGLNEISSIYCSNESAVKLKDEGFKNVHTEWKEEYQTPYMFFTSRFYTGLDIFLKEKPRVLYFSDAKDADYTIMDPKTDMAQACGRFRNGMKEILHYVVFNPAVETKSKEDIEKYINGTLKSFKALKQIFDESNSAMEKKAILKAIESIPFQEYILDGEIDYFLKDNIVDSELLKQLYTDSSTLRDAYGDSGYFRIPWIEEPHTYFIHTLSKNNLSRLSTKEFKYKQRKAIVESLDFLAPYIRTSEINEIVNTFRSSDNTIVDAFFKLGKDFIVQSNYNIRLIRDELSKKRSTPMGYDEAFFETLYKSFEVGKKYLRSEAKKELIRIYEKFNLTPPTTITALSLAWHFEINDKARIGNHKAVEILARKVEGVEKYFKEIKSNTETIPLTSFED